MFDNSKFEIENDTNRIDDLGLINIDNTVKTFIENKIAYEFDDDGKAISTTVRLTKPERWNEQLHKNTIKNRLDQNHINLPLITLYRSGGEITKNVVPHWIHQDLINIPMKPNKRQTYFSEFYEEAELINDLPTSVTLSYDINVISSSKKHNDHLLEQFIHVKGKQWKGGNFPFRASYSSFIDNSESADQNQERIISSSITLDLKGYVRPNKMKNQPTEKREIRKINKIQFGEMEVDDVNNIDKDKLFGR